MLGPLSLVLVRVWVLLPHPPWNFSMIEVFFSNLDIRVVSAIVLVFLGSALVHYFSGAILFYFLVAFRVSSPDGGSAPVYQSSFVISMKLFNVNFGLDNIELNIWQTQYLWSSHLSIIIEWFEYMSSRRPFILLPNLARVALSISYYRFETPILVSGFIILYVS